MNKKKFISLCNKARKLENQIQEIQQTIFNSLNEDILNKNTSAENSNNIEEAIMCYIQYGEYSPEEIWEEIK